MLQLLLGNLLNKAVTVANEKGINVKVGNIYHLIHSMMLKKIHGKNGLQWVLWELKWKLLPLYMNAAYAGVNALCILTVSDSLVTHELTTAEERQNTFTQMMEIALELAE